MSENLTRRGTSSVFAKLFERNNKIELTFNRKTEQSFVVFVDTNILHGGIVEKFPLPLETFLLKKQN